jgi:hypothetical protein
LRQRSMLVAYVSHHIQHMQKALVNELNGSNLLLNNSGR